MGPPHWVKQINMTIVVVLLSGCRTSNNPKADGITDTTPPADTGSQCGLGDDTGSTTSDDTGDDTSGGGDDTGGGGDTGSVDTEPERETTEVVRDEVRYLFVQDHMTWSEAAAMCAAEGMSLVTVDDAEENAWLHAQAWGKGRIRNPVWLGYHDGGEGWRWPDDSAGGFEAFSGEVLVDAYGSAYAGDGAALADPDAAEWQQAPGTWAYAAICEGVGVVGDTDG
jgi:hypothetical protein